MEMYLEETVTRKKIILDTLLINNSMEFSNLLHLLSISPPTLYKEIDQLNNLFGSIIEIKKGIVSLPKNTLTSITEIRKGLYKQSDFLNLLYFFLNNKKRQPIEAADFPISKSKFYTLKSKINSLLQELDLTIKNNFVHGSLLKSNWVKAILDYHYGYSCISKKKNPELFSKVKTFIQNSNSIEGYYLTEKEKQLFFNHLLLIFNSPKEVYLTEEEQTVLHKIIVPPKLENTLKNLIHQVSSVNQENLLAYGNLCFFLLSTHVFSPRVESSYKNRVLNLIKKDDYVSDLLVRIEKETSISLEEYPIALNMLYNHLKKYMLNIHKLDNIATHSSDKNNILFKVFTEWNEEHALQLDLICNTISELWVNLNKVVSLKSKTRLFIYTDCWLKYTETLALIEQHLPMKIELIDYWIESREELINQCSSEDIVISDNLFFLSNCQTELNTYYLNFPPSSAELKKLSFYLVNKLLEKEASSSRIYA